LVGALPNRLAPQIIGTVIVDSLSLGPARHSRDGMGGWVSRVLATAVCLLLAGCAHDSALVSRTETLRAYQSAVRWSHFDDAAAFQNGVTRPPRATDRLRNIRVTGYDVVSEREDKGRLRLHQTVSIHYHHIGESVEKDIIDEQDWHYDEARRRWVIDTPLPRFE